MLSVISVILLWVMSSGTHSVGQQVTVRMPTNEKADEASCLLFKDSYLLQVPCTSWDCWGSRPALWGSYSAYSTGVPQVVPSLATQLAQPGRSMWFRTKHLSKGYITWKILQEKWEVLYPLSLGVWCCLCPLCHSPRSGDSILSWSL